MSTAIAFKGSDLIYGFNLDVDPSRWTYTLSKSKTRFALSLRSDAAALLYHGVTADGVFCCLQKMNGRIFAPADSSRQVRLDRLCDALLRGKLTPAELPALLAERKPVNLENHSMHSLICDASGTFTLLEPGYGTLVATGNSAVLTDFPILAAPFERDAKNGFSGELYGRDRFEQAKAFLTSAEDLSARQALDLLYKLRVDGREKTLFTFVYSHNENAVYYFVNSDLRTMAIWRFDEPQPTEDSHVHP